MYVVFRNKGVIDPRSIFMFGVSAKEKEGAHGKFGTGLKHSIAILLREGCTISANSDGKSYSFCTKKDSLRGKEFDFIHMSVDGADQQLGFTTELGKGQELWCAYRELYCNCMDEDGSVYLEEYYPDVSADETVFVVHGQAFVDIHNKRDEIILNKKVLHSSASLQVCAGYSEYIFYKGIRVYKLDKPSKYTYNMLTETELTEDRTIKHIYSTKSVIASYIADSDNKVFVKDCVVCGNNFFESELDFSYKNPSPEFAEVVRQAYKTSSLLLNATAFSVCKDYAEGFLDGIESKALSKIDLLRLERAKSFLNQMDICIDDYEVIVTDALGENTLGLAKNEKIYLAPRIFNMGTKQLVSCLLEEHTHLKHKLHDESRELQIWLFDKLVSAHEELLGEVL